MSPDAPEVTLAIETAFRTVSVALRVRDVVYEPRTDLGAARAAGLHPAVADVLAQAELPATALRGLLVDVGPGSYTGLRVGIAMARTFAELLTLEVRALYSFDLLAARARRSHVASGEFWVAADARRQQWFLARYRATETGIERVREASCVAVDALDTVIADDDTLVIASGDAPRGTSVKVGEATARELFDCEDREFELGGRETEGAAPTGVRELAVDTDEVEAIRVRLVGRVDHVVDAVDHGWDHPEPHLGDAGARELVALGERQRLLDQRSPEHRARAVRGVRLADVNHQELYFRRILFVERLQLTS